MQKKVKPLGTKLLCFSLIFVFSLSVVSAGLLGDWWGDVKTKVREIFGIEEPSLSPKLQMFEIEFEEFSEPIIRTHKICSGEACVSVEGVGVDECTYNYECRIETPTHKICSGEACISVNGEGTDECSTNAECFIEEEPTEEPEEVIEDELEGEMEEEEEMVEPEETETYKICSGEACISIDGEGTDECSTNAECIIAEPEEDEEEAIQDEPEEEVEEEIPQDKGTNSLLTEITADFNSPKGIIREDFYGVVVGPPSWFTTGVQPITPSGNLPANPEFHKQAFLDSGMNNMKMGYYINGHYSGPFNLDFEEWTGLSPQIIQGSRTSVARGWSFKASEGIIALAYKSSKHKHSGNYSLRLSCHDCYSEGSFVYPYRTIKLGENNLYEFSVWVYGYSGETYLELEHYEELVRSDPVTLDETWKKITVQVDTSIYSEGNWDISLKSLSDSDQVWMDDVEIKKDGEDYTWWRIDENSDGSWNEFMDWANNKDKRMVLTILYSDPFLADWFSPYCKNDGTGTDLVFCTPHYDIWGEVVADIIKRVTNDDPDLIDMVDLEVWGEPHGTFGIRCPNRPGHTSHFSCQGDEEFASEYAKLYESTYDSLKAKYPNLNVGGPSGTAYAKNFTKAFLEETNNKFDFVSHHPYSKNFLDLNSNSIKTHTDWILGLCDDYGVGCPRIIISEWQTDEIPIHRLDRGQSDKYGSSFAAAYAVALNEYPESISMNYYRWAYPYSYFNYPSLYPEYEKMYGSVSEAGLDDPNNPVFYPPYTSTKDFAFYHAPDNEVYETYQGGDGSNMIQSIASKHGNGYAITAINANPSPLDITLTLQGQGFNEDLDWGEIGGYGRKHLVVSPNQDYDCIDNDDDGYGICPNCGWENGCQERGDDCDDTDPSVWRFLEGYEDSDNDSFYSEIEESVCAGDNLPSGYSASRGDDCDDDPTSGIHFYPGAPEFCDGKDNDCDGSTEDDGTDESYYVSSETGLCNDAWDNDCDGAKNCADSECTDDPVCQPVPNNAPAVTNALIISTSSFGLSSDDLRLAFETSDPDRDGVMGITDWRVNDQSMAVLNMPFSIDENPIKDYSTYENHATNYGASLIGGGKIGNAYMFDGINDYIEIPYSSNLDIQEEVSISAWIYRKGTGDYDNGIVANTLGTSWDPEQGYIFGTSPDNDIYFGAAGNSINADNIFNFYEWTHVVGVYDRTNFYIYVNGELKKTDYHDTQNIVSSIHPVWIGRFEKGNSYFNGAIDEVKIFDRALSPEQVKHIYEDNLESHDMEIISGQETTLGSNWDVKVTPSDGIDDGQPIFSNKLHIIEGDLSTCGDVNGDGNPNILDITYMIAWLYKGGPAPPVVEVADVNANGVANILDITYMIAWLYKGGPAPPDQQDICEEYKETPPEPTMSQEDLQDYLDDARRGEEAEEVEESELNFIQRVVRFIRNIFSQK